MVVPSGRHPLALGLVVVLLIVARLGGTVFVWEVVRLARRAGGGRSPRPYTARPARAPTRHLRRWFTGQFTVEGAFANSLNVEPFDSRTQFAERSRRSFLLVPVRRRSAAHDPPKSARGDREEAGSGATLEALWPAAGTRREIVMGKLAPMLHMGGSTGGRPDGPGRDDPVRRRQPPPDDRSVGLPH